MLLLKPVWIYAVVSFWVSCARSHFSALRNIWDSSYFSCIVVVMSTIFVPLETWIVLRNFEWDTIFRVSNQPETVSVVLAAANLAHVLSAVVGYIISVHILQSHGISALIRSSIGCFTLFFCSIGVFQETLLYAGSSEEYHKGISLTLSDFISSGTFHDSYLIFSLVFGPPFIGLAVVWNSGYTPQDRGNFLTALYVESGKQVLGTVDEMSNPSSLEELRQRRLAFNEKRLETAADLVEELDTLALPKSNNKNSSCKNNICQSVQRISPAPSVSSGPRKPHGKGSKTMSSLLQMYCSVPKCDITGEQLAEFISIQFKIKIFIPVIKANEGGRLYCFLNCKNEKDYEKLLKVLAYDEDVTLPDNSPDSTGDIPGTLWVKPPLHEHEEV
ncbi:hypothetical protein ACHWQZ_G011619 [Mnemiopsis leidyi]